MTARSANSGNQKPQLDDNLLKLKKQYPQELSSLKTLFADWTESDLLTTLEEVQGDLDLAIGRISEGNFEGRDLYRSLRKLEGWWFRFAVYYFLRCGSLAVIND